MSVRIKVVEAFAEAEQSSPARWQRITGTLSNAGYTPKGSPGGGVGSAHFFAPALAACLMSTAALVPSDATEVVERLEGLRASAPPSLARLFRPDGNEPVVVVPPGTTLREYLEQQIAAWAIPTAEMLAALDSDVEHPWAPGWSLELAPSDGVASLRVHLPDSGWHSAMFFAQRDLFPRSSAKARRKVELTLAIIKVTGDLLQDSLARQLQTLPLLSEPRARTASDTKNENAAPGRTAPRRPRKRVATADGLHRPAATLALHGRERQHVVRGLHETGIPPFGDLEHEHAANPAFA